MRLQIKDRRKCPALPAQPETRRPLRIRTIRADNAKEIIGCLFGLRKRAVTGNHEFDQLCNELAIDHPLAPPRHPQTNGLVERFNGRIGEVLQSHHFRSGELLVIAFVSALGGSSSCTKMARSDAQKNVFSGTF